MAVYTKIDRDDIRLINNKFNIEKIINFQGIKQGIENTNYLLKSKNKKFILTIFEKRVSNKEIPFFIKLMDELNHSNISFPKLKIDNTNSNIIFIGPEGDFSVNELNILRKKNKFVSFTLGKRILRSETAAISSLVLFNSTQD